LLNEGDSALLTVNKKLDYKIQSEFTLTVKAADAGRLYDTVPVNIKIIDVNSPPYFSEYYLRVSNEKSNQHVLIWKLLILKGTS